MPLEDLLASLPKELLMSGQELVEGGGGDNDLEGNESHGESTSLKQTRSHSPLEEEMEAAVDGKERSTFNV